LWLSPVSWSRFDSMQPNPGELPVPDFLSISPETMSAVAALQHEHRQVRMEEAFRALVELRGRFAGFSKRLVVMVYVPQCEDCYANERHQLGLGDDTWRPPDVMARTWRRDLREFGATERDLRRIYDLNCDPTIEIPPVRCKTCEGGILYGKENVYVGALPFEEYFPELLGREDRDPPLDPPEFVRQLVYRTYDKKCAGCGTHLSWDQRTMDHIRPRHVGGPGTLENIQLACAACNEQKGQAQPPDVHLWLDFPLIPPGPEFRELQKLSSL
ncbi:MAG TPA: HNH endonuclease signature motif containing protein, partial [Nitrospiraceae bacterium]|nr:HNH endonuclease signature motif containing protein [Nitrospiraceae bacterium]